MIFAAVILSASLKNCTFNFIGILLLQIKNITLGDLMKSQITIWGGNKVIFK